MDKRVRKVLNDFIQKFAALFLVIAMSLTPCITGMGQVFADEPEGDGDVTYGLDIKESEHGKVEIKDSDQTSFKENDEVTLTVTPDDNYELEKVSVLSEDGTEITSATEGSEFTFTMPAANLSVEASFVEKEEKEVTEWVKCELSVQGNGIVAIYDEDDFSAEYHFLDGKMYDMEENVVEDQTVKVPKDKDLEICFVPDDSYCVEALSLKNSKGEDVEYTLDNELPSYTSTMEYKTSGNISLDVTFIVIGTKYIDLGITADDLDSAAWESQGTGQTLAEFLGFDGSTYVSFLKQHSTDSTYIGTPYVEDYAQAYHDGANGFAGWLDAAGVGMNCEGFVDNVLKNVEAKHPMANYPHSTLGFGTGGWVHYINHYNLKHYVFGSKQDMLNSGVLEYGDIIWIFDQSGHNAISDNHHIGIFVGSNSHEDKWWDSIDAKSNQYGTTIGGNHIESIVPKTSYTSEWVVVKAGGETKGYAKVQKVSSNPYLVQDNPCYSLAGAEYGVYKDKGLTQKVATLTTDANGNTGTVELDAGTYYVKETKASKGYKTDDNRYTVNVTSGQTATVTSTEVPNADPMGISLTKIDQDSNGTANVKGLEGAQFEVKYYAVNPDDYNSAADLDGVEATRTWVLETKYKDGEYKARLDDDFKVSGDDFYYDDDENKCLPIGVITVEEKVAPEGYKLDGATFSSDTMTGPVEGKYFAKVLGNGEEARLDGGNEYTVADKSIRGGIKVAKWDNESNSQTPQGDATIGGATIEIVNKNDYEVVVNGEVYGKDQTVMTLTTDGEGNAQTASDALPYGLYEVKETGAPDGYLNEGNTISQEVFIAEDGVIVDLNNDTNAIKNNVIRGGVKLGKWDNEFNSQTPQGDATLEGATFAIISQNNNNVIVNGKTYKKGETVATITTDKNGNAQTSNTLLPYGTYTLKETSAPTGYLNKGTNITQTFKIRENGTIIDLNKDATAIKNDVIRGGVKLGKWDIEANAQIPLGGATLEGAEFTITNESSHSVIVNGKTYKKGEVITTLTTNAKGIAETSNTLLPYGTYSYKETKPPKGYNATGSGLSGTFKIRENGVIVDLNNDQSAIKNDVIRGDIYFSKADEETSERMANIPFKITSNTTGESHTIMTDENGYFSSSSDFNKHSQDTNGGKATSGLWFGLGADGKNVKVNDKKGALPYDTYTLEELRCDANKDKVLYKGTFTVSREAYEIDLGTIENADLTLSTVLKDEETNSHYSQVSDDVTLIDTATYTGLKKNTEYVITGILMDKDTGKPALDPAGNQITATKTFKPKTAEGTVEVEYAFDASNMEGKTLVAFETVTLNGEEVVPDNDINNLDQTIYFPGVKTTALDEKTNDHISKADEETVIIDTVEYTGLRVGKKYTVQGTLMDKETGEAVLDNDGNEITASETFKADKASGFIDITFKFNSSNLKGKTVVAFETILYKDKEYATHADLSDTDQTIHFPEIGTTAADVKTNTGLSLAEKDMTIIDKVEYKNLLAGKSYTVKGTLMNKDTGKALEINGQKVTAEKTFTAESENGTVDLSFTFDGSALAGETLVVFEDLYYNGVSVAVHKDLEDENQTVHIPEIGTTAKSDKTGINVNKAEKEVTLVDTVKYENLIPGKEYTVDGKLMDKETGKAFVVDEKEVTASAKFTPEEANGTIDITFKFDGTGLEEKSLVAFETVSYEGHEVAIHTDIKDEGQTVHFPKIKTTALDEKTEDHIGKADEKMTIIDTVKYTNLVKDKEYTVSGTLMDKETGKAIVDKDGKEVTASTTFTAEKANGTVDIVFTFDSSLLAGKTIVAFEDVSYKGVSIGTHADLTDEDQTVYIPKIHTTAIDDETQTKNSYADGMISITDTVTYENLIPGKEYTLKGTLKDRTTGETVVAKVAKTEEIPEGATAITFNEGTYAYVAKGTETAPAGLYEKTEAGYVLSGTTDVVELPEDLITWGGNFDGPGVGYVKDGEVTVLDYTFTESAEEVVAEKTFTPTEANGTVDLTFVFDGSEMAGQTFVVFEDVYYKNVNVATHSDITDEDQTIYVPEIKTSAKDEASNSQNALASKETTIVDTVNYTNLIPGKEYTVKGKLYDKKTKEALLVDGKEVTGETTFTPESASGSVDITFKFDSSALKNQTIVVFEDLFIGEKQVATHSDINDKDQSIYFPEIKTTATDKSDGDHEAYATSNVTITDAVKYENLLPGTSYKVEGTLMDKETGKAILVNGKEVKAEASFTPEESSGTVNVDFTFNASSLGGKSVVVFEKLYTAEGKEIANHEDINDEGQTVKLVTPPKTTTVQTGDTYRMYGLIAGAVVLVVIGGCVFFKKNKKKDNKKEN